MARITPIRISANDRKEYQRLARNAKAKIRRTKKKYGIDLSSEIDIPTIDSFKTRKQFNKWKDRQASFTNRYNLDYQFVKNKYNVVATKKEINKIVRDTKVAQRKAQEEIDKHKNRPFYYRGKQEGTVGDRMVHMDAPAVLGIHVPKDFNFGNVRNTGRLKTIKDSMDRKANEDEYSKRLEQLKDNFLDALAGSFNSEADELRDLLQDIPPDVFYRFFIEFGEFDFDLYDSEGQEVQANTGHIERMTSYAEKYLSGEMKADDLQNF